MEKRNLFAGCNVAVTGKLEHFTRKEVCAEIAALGGNPRSGVSGTTDFLICGEKCGGKLARAQELGTRVISEREFLEMAALRQD